MSATIKGRTIDQRTIQELGGLELGDLEKASSPARKIDIGARLTRPFLQIPLAQIAGASPMQTRLESFDPEKYEEDEDLLKSVKKFGVLEPIMVLDTSPAGGSEDYQIVFGHRRVDAARLAGLVEITAMITRDKAEARILTLAENMGGRALTPYEKALALSGLKEAHPDLSVRSLGQRTGIPFQTVSTLLRSYQESPPALRGMFAEGLAPGAVLELTNLFESAPENEHPSLAKSMQGLTRRQAQAIRSMVECGTPPLDAIQTVLHPGANLRASHVRPAEPTEMLENDENGRHTFGPLTKLPSLSDRGDCE